MPAGGLVTAAIIAGIGAAAGIAGGVIGNAASADDRKKAKDAAMQAYEKMAGYKMPKIEQDKLDLKLPQVMSQYKAEQERTIKQDDSLMGGISTDPGLKAAQMRALEHLQQVGEEGLTEEDRAVLNQAKREMSKQASSREATIMQNLAQRGIAGGGQELAARLMNSQGTANQEAEAADRAAIASAQRKTAAMQSAGNMAGQVRGQEWGEKSDQARAQDAINSFNAANSQGVESRNVGARNTGNMYNTQTAQRVAEAGVGIQNDEQKYNAELARNLQQQNLENDLKKLGLTTEALKGQSDQYAKSGQQTADMWTGIGSGVANAAGSVAGYAGKASQSAPTTAVRSATTQQRTNPTSYGNKRLYELEKKKE